MTLSTPLDEERETKLNELLRRYRNATIAMTGAQSREAMSHWSDRSDEHERDIRALFASRSSGEPSAIPEEPGDEPDIELIEGLSETAAYLRRLMPGLEVDIDRIARAAALLRSLLAARPSVEPLAATVTALISSLEDSIAETDWKEIRRDLTKLKAAQQRLTRALSGGIPRSLSPADVGMLYHTAREYEDSAFACDTPTLARFRVERTQKAADLRALADRLAAPRSLGEEPSDTEMLDWWFSCGLHDSVCDGSVDLWWADEEDGDAVERVTHGTTLRETLAMAMRGEYLED